ncbi:hypermethylated in cancer 2 protein-like [Oncorhynchus keta]|uniref:hypermethylated in cancer 2 protein-like n=1 Tax=Oncorhynchus keta TaxID=8018 RepID=UPI0015FBE51D|nr:hypermethylated in cancer 2 protein-like [Oncorhynchus keta]
MEQQNHFKQLLLQLNQQRAKGYLCDVIIVVENALFRAHKNVLAASSVYFKSLVPHDNLINLDTEMVSPSVFRQVLDFIYTGRLSSSDSVSDHSVSSLLTAASYLQLTELAALCRRKLKHNGQTPSSSNKLTTSSTSPTPNGHTPGPLRLSSTPPRATPSHHNNHSGSRKGNLRSQRWGQEGRLREDLSEEEVFISGSRCASLSPSGGSRVNGLALGLDLSKRSPSGSTATEEVSPSSLPQSSSPHSSSVSPTPPTKAEPRENQRQLPNTSTDLLPRAPCKRPRPHREATNLGETGKALHKGLVKKPGAPGHKKLVRGDRVTPELEDGEVDGEENGQDQSEESGHSGSEGGGGGGAGGKRNGNTNYIYRQPQPGFEPGVGDNLYVCIPCGKGFPSSEQLNAHVDTHTQDEIYLEEEEEEEEGGGYRKDEDPDIYASRGVEPGADEPRHRCTVCSKTCKDAVSLREHEKSHWLNRPFPCNICGKLFTQRGTMTRHMRSHLGLKPFACEECGMRFTRQYRLAEHMRVHSGEKPYECQLCGGKFTQQRNLLSHLKMHTSPS